MELRDRWRKEIPQSDLPLYYEMNWMDDKSCSYYENHKREIQEKN